jgi:hypothetical protein
MPHWSVFIAIAIGIIWAIICERSVRDLGRNSYGNRPHSYWRERVKTATVFWLIPMIFFLAIWGGIFWW